MNNFNFTNHFTEIYLKNEWGCGSGGGSTIQNNEIYINFLENFINKNEIKKIIDYGCGDWQSSKLINWGDSEYLGIDCVESLIVSHNKTYGRDTINFKFLDNLNSFFDYKSELLIIKDVIQHWTNDEILFFLEKIQDNHDYILITNSSEQTEEWQEEPYRSRPLTANLYPLKQFKPTILKAYKIYNGTHNKEISLITKKNNYKI